MAWWSRFANVFRRDRLIHEIDEEIESHIAEAIEHGRNSNEAQRAFGSTFRKSQESYDIRIIPWLDALRADMVFGWRQLRKNRITSAAAILSLGLAIGACTSAFRLIDALLLRPLPIANPERLYVLMRQGIGPDSEAQPKDNFEYPLFREMRTVAKDQAELIAISFAQRIDLRYSQSDEMEKANRQYVSGSMFSTVGLRPALGRLFTENDDLKHMAHPYAVLSHDYWTRRFGENPNVIGRTFRMGDDLYEIIGVVEENFTGTERGIVTDIFIPTMMHPGINRYDWSWFRTFVFFKNDVDVQNVLTELNATFRSFRQDVAKNFLGRSEGFIGEFVNEKLMLEIAASGVSNLKNDFRNSLIALGVIVALVLFIACANVANLMTARAEARSSEMALRISLGAGRGRLVQLVLLESILIACLAAVIGGMFSWWSAPFVVNMINTPDNPARLSLPVDWRLFVFGLALALIVICLFGLAPALRASSVNPISTIKAGSGSDSRRRLMRALIAAQVAFCILVHFVTGLFVATFDRLSNQPTGFSDEQLITLDAVAQRVHPDLWNQVADHLREVSGVSHVAMSGWPLMSGEAWSVFVSVNGAPPSEVRPYFLNISPGWIDTMKIRFIDGRDFRANDTYPGVAIVNETFAKQYFNGENPIGKWFEETPSRGDALPKEASGIRLRSQIVGLAGDGRYSNMREPFPPVVYVPFNSTNANGEVEVINWGTFIVRTSVRDPLLLAPVLRQQVPRARPEFRISNIRTQTSMNESHTVRERLLATLALFFAVVALLLAGIGLYGVLYYSVLQRRREIGIRLALGSPVVNLARQVTLEVFKMILIGAFLGLAIGLASVRYIESLFYQVKATEPGILAFPPLIIVAVSIVAAIPPIIYAFRIDPVSMLRAD